ncbi:MAG: GNAT family N-acetyltransferase [Rhodothermia bacterium]|nr:GNAT family N-acetyltransferase [Rhodothermia bacterium]
MMKRLDWDSKFFGFEIAEWDSKALENPATYDLIVVKSDILAPIHLSDFVVTFHEEKRLYVKECLASPCSSPSVLPLDTTNSKAEYLYGLAFESGKFSRFRLDPYFKEEDFRRLYRRWVDASVAGHLADQVFIFYQYDAILGFVTVKLLGGKGQVGLVAAHPEYQNRGIGTELLCAVEKFCVENGANELHIPTQAMNLGACVFYEKKGYKLQKTTYIQHLWKKRRDTN